MESLDGTGGAGDNEEGLAYGLLPKVLDFFFWQSQTFDKSHRLLVCGLVL
jgi:hypothetical protein